MKFLFLPHVYYFSPNAKNFVCQRCGNMFDVYTYNSNGIIDNYVMMKLMESTCMLKYEDVKDLLEYMTVNVVHKT